MRSVLTHVALLRGINVGGHRKLPMAKLRELCRALGWKDVRTYIQSGNVLFCANRPDPEALAGVIRDRFGFDVPVILRSVAELIAARGASPWSREAATSKNVHVMFLSRRPAARAVARLDPDRSPPDRFAVVGSEVHLNCPNGSARTKLTVDWFEESLGVRATVRNWRTLERLIELSG
jgi:uncharacterized protein (DUF1697 family)